MGGSGIVLSQEIKVLGLRLYAEDSVLDQRFKRLGFKDSTNYELYEATIAKLKRRLGTVRLPEALTTTSIPVNPAAIVGNSQNKSSLLLGRV